MLKQIFMLCVVILTIKVNAQVIKSGRSQNIEPTNVPQSYAPYDREQKAFEFKKRSMIQLNLFQFVFTNVSISYELFSKDGKTGIKIPFTFGIGGQPDNSAYSPDNIGRFIAAKNRIFETGLHYNYYFVGQRRASPFFGIGFNVGAFNYWGTKTTLMYNSYNGYYYNQTTPGDQKVGVNYAGALFGGILFNPNETVTFGLKTGLGFRRYTTDASYTEYTKPYGLLEINLGFKF